MTRIYKIANQRIASRIIAEDEETALKEARFLQKHNDIELCDMTEEYLTGDYCVTTRSMLDSGVTGIGVLVIPCLDLRDILLGKKDRKSTYRWVINDIEFKVEEQ